VHEPIDAVVHGVPGVRMLDRATDHHAQVEAPPDARTLEGAAQLDLIALAQMVDVVDNDGNGRVGRAGSVGAIVGRERGGRHLAARAGAGDPAVPGIGEAGSPRLSATASLLRL
jgi:hypothetical protein